MSLRYLLLLTVIPIILFSVALTLVIAFNSFYDFFSKQEIESNMASLERSVELIELKLQNLYYISNGLSENQEIITLLDRKASSLLVQLEYNKDVHNILLSFSGAMENVNSIICYIHDYFSPEDYQVGGRQNQLFGYGLRDYKAFEAYVLNDYIYNYNERMALNIYHNPGFNQTVINTLQPVFSGGSKELGVLSIAINTDYLFSNLATSETDETIVLDSDGRYLFDKARKTPAPSTDESWFSRLDGEQKGYFFYKNSENNNELLLFRKLNTFDWYIIKRIPFFQFEYKYRQALEKIFLLTAVLVALVIIISLFLARLITNPLQRIVVNFKNYPEKALFTGPKPVFIREIESLDRNFHRMVDRIDSLNLEKETALMKEHEAELKALQMQINSHFLYNTLDLIHWMTDNPKISDLITHLASFYRLSLSKGRQIITVDEEIRLARNYTRIQQIRMPDKFDFKEEIDENMLKSPMLKIVLQPLIENSLVHGFKYKKTGGLIVLKLFERKGGICFQIIDNGTGVDLERINYLLQAGPGLETSYGIYNVNERLVMKYGSDSGLRYSVNESGGTTVEISLPIGKQESHV